MLIDNALRGIADFTGGVAVSYTESEPLSERLAAALGWQQGSARLENLEIQDGRLKLVRGFLGPQRASVFATNGTGATQQFLPDVARFAYHSSIHWGLAADEDGAVIFNSHWIRDEEWFRLPKIRWSELNEYRDVLTAITPQGMAAGHLDQIATRIRTPDRVLTPVDDALVARLDHWRLQALRFGDATEELDEDLHTLFAQFFVLRAVEDRRLAPDIPSLASTVIEQQVDIERLRTLFGRARAAIQSQLFASDPAQHFPSFILAGIIDDLYTPSQLPPGSQQYNFAWIDADVLGRAYEKYLANVFKPISPSPQLHLFNQPLREVERVNVKKSGGVYYTPDYLVGTLTDQAIDRVLSEPRDPDFIPRVADFACGSGSFLVEAVSVLLRRLRERDPHRNWVRTLIEGKHVVGIDVDPRAVTLSRMNLWIRFTDEPDALPLPSIDEVIVVGDSLGEEVWTTLPRSYDVVVGNPPFIATAGIQSREELGRRFKTAQGRFDYAHLFVELAVNRLAFGGVLGMVVPNRLFRNRDAGIVRQILAAETDLLIIVDFGPSEVFERISVYIGAIVARKHNSVDSQHPATVRVVLVSDVSDTRYPGGALTAAIRIDGEFRAEALSAFDINQPSGNQTWVLLSPSARRARLRLEQDAVPLGEFAGVYQGIRTGANDIFIVGIESTDGSLARVTNLLGDPAILDATLLHPVVFGSDIQRYDLLPAKQVNRMLLYPYRRGAVLSEMELEEEFPSTYRYLMAYRDLLSSRSSITSSGLRWYELVRKRDETWLSSRKLLIRDLAMRTSFALDDEGQVFLVGGNAVVPSDSQSILPLLAYLNSAIANEYLAELTPAFRGAFQKFEPQHLAQLPIPAFLVELDETAMQLGELAQVVLQSQVEGQEERGHEAEAAIDRIVVRAVGRSV
jgi:type I restriction-modification system DNA methylase subunit